MGPNSLFHLSKEFQGYITNFLLTIRLPYETALIFLVIQNIR